MTTVYRSKVDAWLVGLLASSMAVSLYGASQVIAVRTPAVWFVAALIAGVGVGLPLWLLVSTRYTLESTQLVVRSGPFTWRIRLADITAITPSSNPMSSPALSLDRLRIDHGRGQSLLISPVDQSRFIAAVEAARRRAT